MMNRYYSKYRAFYFFCILAALFVLCSCTFKDVKYYHEEAAVHLAAGRPDAALKSYEAGIALDADSYTLLYNAGVLELESARFSKARDYFVRSARSYPDFALVYYKLGQSYMGLKQYKAAEFSFKRALEKDPDLIACYLEYAFYFTENSMYKEALAILEKASASDLADERVFFNLGKLYTHQKQYAHALTNLQAVLERGLTNWQTQALVAGAHVELGNYSEAETFIGNMPGGRHTDLHKRILQARLYFAMEQPKKAEAALLELAAAYPDSFDTVMTLAHVYASMKQYEEALLYYERASLIDYASRDARLAMASMYFVQKKFSPASELLEMLNTHFPNDAAVLAMLSRVYYERRYFDRVIAYGERALPLNKDDTELQALLGMAYVRADDRTLINHKKAIELLWPLRDLKVEGIRTYLRRALDEEKDPRAASVLP